MVNRRGALLGLWVAGVALGGVLLVAHLWHGVGLFNDYYDYWAAGTILNQGGDPYDPRLVGQVLSSAGIQTTVGDYGYSYPLVLAELMRPAALLSPTLSAALFCGLSAVALAIAVALLASPLRHVATWKLLALATACAVFSPIDGTLYFGQVNLLLLPLLVLAWRGRAREAGIAVAAAVKLYPSVTAGAFLFGPRRELKPLAWCLGLTAALVLVPLLLLRHLSYSRTLLGMIGPDTFWSDQSLNGFLSRLGQPSQWTVPPLPGLPVTPLMLGVCAALGIVVVMLLIGPARGSWQARYALLLWFAVVVAPKNSLWNFTPLVIVFAYCLASGLRRGVATAALVAAFLLLEAQQVVNAARDSLYHGLAAMTWVSSLGFYGAVLLGAATMLAVAAERCRDEVQPTAYC